MIFYYDNDPFHPFSLPYSEIKSVLHIGKTTIAKAIKQLIDGKYWILINKGGRNRSAIYRHNHSLLSVYEESTSPV
jgi:hypothetical protein